MTVEKNLCIEVDADTPEPTVCSVVMVHGLHGTAYQKHARTSMWHSTTNSVRSWDDIRYMDREDTFIIFLSPDLS